MTDTFKLHYNTLTEDVAVTQGELVEGAAKLNGANFHATDQATDAASLLEQPNFYVHAPSRTDPSASPSVLLPVAHLGEGYNKGKTDNDEAIVDATRTRIFKRFMKAGLGDISSNILFEEVFTPPIWRDTYNLQHGAAFGLSHNLQQLDYFRPDVANADIRGLYFTGASTRPGNGVPLVLMGAKLTSNRILEDLS